MPRLSRREPKAAKRRRMKSEMHKFGRGELHSGSKDGPVVTDRKQALAIGLHQAGLSRKGRKGRRKGRRASPRGGRY